MLCSLVSLPCAASPLIAQSPHGWTIRDTSAVVVECRIGDVAARVMEAHLRGDTLYLPLRTVLATAGLDSAGGAGERSLAAVAALLHTDATFDSASLIVQLGDSGTLPVSRRAARARARADLLDRARVHLEPSVGAAASGPPSAATLNYVVQRDGTLSVDATSQLMGGVVAVAMSGHLDRAPRPRMTWSSTSPAADGTRLRIGALDELAGGIGVSLTNAPLQQRDTLAQLRVAVPLQRGSELELYDDGALVAAESIGTTASAGVLLARRRGTHAMRLVVYDSTGASRERRWMAFTPDALLLPGSFQYALSAGRCTGSPCTIATATAAYAPFDGVTVRSNWSLGPPHENRRSTDAAFTLDASIGAATALSASRGADGTTSMVVRQLRSAGSELEFRSDAPGASALLTDVASQSAAEHRVTAASASWEFSRKASVRLSGATNGTTEMLSTAASLPMSAGVVQASASIARLHATHFCARWNAGVLGRGTWLPRSLALLRSTLVRVSAARSLEGCGRSASRDLLLVLPMIWASVLELSASWRGAARRPTLSLSVRRQIGSAMRVHAAIAEDAASRSVVADVGGSIVVDRLSRDVRFSATPGAGNAGVHGVVYVDENANGRLDEGEPPVADVVVRCGDRSVASDERGVFALSSLPAERVAQLSVDSLSIEDAQLEPELARSVVLVSGIVARVDVPLRRRSALRSP